MLKMKRFADAAVAGDRPRAAHAVAHRPVVVAPPFSAGSCPSRAPNASIDGDVLVIRRPSHPSHPSHPPSANQTQKTPTRAPARRVETPEATATATATASATASSRPTHRVLPASAADASGALKPEAEAEDEEEDEDAPPPAHAKLVRVLAGPRDADVSANFKTESADVKAAASASCGDVARMLAGGGPILRGATHVVNTVGFDIQLALAVRGSGSPKVLDVEVLDELMQKPEVVEYNRRVLGWQPVVQPLRFNDSKGLLIGGKGWLSKNKVHAKLFKTLKVQIAGPQSGDELLGVAEYLRGLVQAIMGLAIKLDSISLHNINSALKLSTKLNRAVLSARLLALLEDDEWTDGRTVVHYEVDFRPKGKKAYAGVKMFLAANDASEAKMPTLLFFACGYVMIMSRSHEVLLEAIRYMRELEARGVLRDASATAAAEPDDDATPYMRAIEDAIDDDYGRRPVAAKKKKRASVAISADVCDAADALAVATPSGGARGRKRPRTDDGDGPVDIRAAMASIDDILRGLA